MAAGFKYDLQPAVETEERYDVQTGIRRRGEYKLVTEHLSVGATLPVFAPIFADLKDKFAYPVVNMTVAEAYTTGDANLSIKVAKGSLAYKGMFVGNGAKGAKVTAVDTTNSEYDTITIEAAFGANLPEGTVLFEAKTASGTAQKYIANSALFNKTKVDDGIVLVALLRTAAEIEPGKLAIPFSAVDKANMKGWFEFNE